MFKPTSSNTSIKSTTKKIKILDNKCIKKVIPSSFWNILPENSYLKKNNYLFKSEIQDEDEIYDISDFSNMVPFGFQKEEEEDLVKNQNLKKVKSESEWSNAEEFKCNKDELGTYVKCPICLENIKVYGIKASFERHYKICTRKLESNK